MRAGMLIFSQRFSKHLGWYLDTEATQYSVEWKITKPINAVTERSTVRPKGGPKTLPEGAREAFSDEEVVCGVLQDTVFCHV